MGSIKTVAFHADPTGVSQSTPQWLVSKVPVGTMIQAGSAPVPSMEPTDFRFPGPGAPEGPSAPPPPTTPTLTKNISPIATAGSITITGRWQYADRSGVWRDIDRQVIE